MVGDKNKFEKVALKCLKTVEWVADSVDSELSVSGDSRWCNVVKLDVISKGQKGIKQNLKKKEYGNFYDKFVVIY